MWLSGEQSPIFDDEEVGAGSFGDKTALFTYPKNDCASTAFIDFAGAVGGAGGQKFR